jgi:hypothetical protein
LLNESLKWSDDAIERALSHADANQVRAAYHRGAHWPERVEMAQWWSDHLRCLRAGSQVFDLRATSKNESTPLNTKTGLGERTL